MNEKVKTLMLSMDEQLDANYNKNENSIHSENNAIEIIHSTLLSLREFIIHNGFVSPQSEIDFFKHKKPQILSRLIYHKAIHSILVHKPHGGVDIIRQYLNDELLKLKLYFDENIDLYTYHRIESESMDHIYFVRENPSQGSCQDINCYQNDHLFCTSHDFRIATILANDQIEIYLSIEISKQQENNIYLNPLNLPPVSKLTWTDSKTSLTELIYALHKMGVFNNGNASLSEISKHFQSSYDIKLGNIYKIFQEMKERKINLFPFIDAMKNALVKYIKFLDDKLN